jgi:hypothetical protein
MGARYERPATGVAAGSAGATDAAAPDGEPHAAAARPRRTHASMWDDLDRGVDPTDE